MQFLDKMNVLSVSLLHNAKMISNLIELDRTTPLIKRKRGRPSKRKISRVKELKLSYMAQLEATRKELLEESHDFHDTVMRYLSRENLDSSSPNSR